MSRFRSATWLTFVSHWFVLGILLIGAFGLGSLLHIPAGGLVERAQACDWVTKCGVSGCSNNASGFAAACEKEAKAKSSASSNSSSNNGGSGSSGSQKCDGWADNGSTHRNSGNGCNYTCKNGSWSGPNQCDGSGNGQFQGEAAVSTDERARQEEAVRERQKEAEDKVREQGAEVTAQIAAQTEEQRAKEAARQQAMVESQRQTAVAEAQAQQNQAAIDEANRRAQEASQQVSQAQGTERGSEIVGSGDLRARDIAAIGYDPNSPMALGTANMSQIPQASQVALANAAVNIANLNGACDVNTGVPNSVGAGAACCRGGVVECGGGTNGSCMSNIDRPGVVGYCGATGQPDLSGYCGDNFCQTTETAQSCSKDCAVTSSIGYRLYSLENGECVPCVPGATRGCVSLAACSPQQVMPRSAAAQLEVVGLTSLYQRCYFDIDMAEGTLDPGCVSQINRAEKRIQDLEEGASILAGVQVRVQAERRVYALAGAIANQQINCLGGCNEEIAANQQALQKALTNLQNLNPTRADDVREKSEQYQESIRNASVERVRLAEQQRRAVLALAEACGQDNADCIEDVKREAEVRLGNYSQDSVFCHSNPNAATCELSMDDIKDQIDAVIENIQEVREEVSSCSQGTYETAGQCDPLGGCTQNADGCWQKNTVTGVPSTQTPSQPTPTVPVTCGDGTLLNTRNANGQFCNASGELIGEVTAPSSPQQPGGAVPGSGMQIPGYQEFFSPTGQVLDANACRMRGYSVVGSTCYASVRNLAPAPAGPSLEQQQQAEEVVRQTLTAVVELNREIVDLETRRLTAIADGRTQFAAVIQEEIDALKSQRQILARESIQSVAVDSTLQTALSNQLQEALRRNNDQIRDQRLLFAGGIASENQYLNQQLNSYKGLVQQLQNATDNPTTYTQVRAQITSLEGTIEQLCPPSNMTPTCNQVRDTVNSSQSVLQATQEQTAKTGLENLLQTVEQQVAVFTHPVQGEVVRLYPDQQSCERSGWSQCAEIPSQDFTGFYPTATATYSDPNPFRSAANTLLGLTAGKVQGEVVFNGVHSFSRVESGRCHAANHIAGTNMMINGVCYQSSGDTAITYPNPNDSNSCVSNEQYTRNLVNGLCLSTLKVPEEVVQASPMPPVDENGGTQLVEEALQAVKELNQEIYDLEVLRLTAVIEGRFRSAATIQEEIDALKSQRQIVAIQNAKSPLLDNRMRQQLATQLQESITESNEQISEQRLFFQEGAVQEANRVRSQRDTYQELVQQLQQNTNNPQIYTQTREQITALERSVPALCPPSNVTEQCISLRETVSASQDILINTQKETAQIGLAALVTALQEQQTRLQNPINTEYLRSYENLDACTQAGWSDCSRSREEEFTYFSPTADSDFRDPNLLRFLTHTIVSNLTQSGGDDLAVGEEQVLQKVESGKCHISRGQVEATVLVNGSCYQADSNSHLQVLDQNAPDSCQSDETYRRSRVEGFCLSTLRLPDIAVVEEAPLDLNLESTNQALDETEARTARVRSEIAQDSAAARVERARVQRNAQILSQFLNTGLGAVTPIATIAWSTWTTLSEMGSNPPTDYGEPSQTVFLECSDFANDDQPSYQGSTRTVRQVCDHLNRDRGYSTCTPERVDGSGEIILCNKNAFDNLSSEQQALLLDHELLHSQFQDRPGRALHDYCSSQGISIDDVTYSATSPTQKSCIGVAELGAQIISYDAFGEDYGFILVNATGQAQNFQATTQQAVNHLSSNCPGASSETIVSALLGDSESYGQLVRTCTAPPHELIPDRYRRYDNVPENLDEHVLDVAVQEYQALADGQTRVSDEVSPQQSVPTVSLPAASFTQISQTVSNLLTNNSRDGNGSYFSQRDAAWADLPVSYNSTIERSGAGIVATAMILSSVDPAVTPESVLTYYQGPNQVDGATVSLEGTSLKGNKAVLNANGFETDYILLGNTVPSDRQLRDVYEPQIREYLDAGWTVWVNGNDASGNGHHTLIVDYNDDGFIFNDPYYGEEVELELNQDLYPERIMIVRPSENTQDAL